MTWDTDARHILKAEVVRRGLSYERLAIQMRAMGIEETTRSIANKMSRGTFSFVFFLQCMKALGAETVTISLTDIHLNGPRPDVEPASALETDTMH